MKEESNPAEQPRGEGLPFLFVGDHPAVDLVNTVYRTPDGSLVDALQTDSDVQRWLARTNLSGASDVQEGELLRAARSLRTAVRTILETRRSGEPVTEAVLAPLNRFLAHARSHVELKPARAGLELARKWQQNTAEEALAPLAESAALLIASSDFGLVKHCEDSQCVLWFLDQTKSHHRRWCSMAVCGNRNKVAAYRQRKQREA